MKEEEGPNLAEEASEVLPESEMLKLGLRGGSLCEQEMRGDQSLRRGRAACGVKAVQGSQVCLLCEEWEGGGQGGWRVRGGQEGALRGHWGCGQDRCRMCQGLGTCRGLGGAEKIVQVTHLVFSEAQLGLV